MPLASGPLATPLSSLYREADEISPTVRLRIALDVIEVLAQAKISLGRRSSGGLSLEQVSLGGDGGARVSIGAARDGVPDLVWEILAGRASEGEFNPLHEVVDDMPIDVSELVQKILGDDHELGNAGELFEAMDSAASGHVAPREEVKRIVAVVRSRIEPKGEAEVQSAPPPPAPEPAQAPPAEAKPAQAPPEPAEPKTAPRAVPPTDDDDWDVSAPLAPKEAVSPRPPLASQPEEPGSMRRTLAFGAATPTPAPKAPPARSPQLALADAVAARRSPTLKGPLGRKSEPEIPPSPVAKPKPLTRASAPEILSLSAPARAVSAGDADPSQFTIKGTQILARPFVPAKPSRDTSATAFETTMPAPERGARPVGQAASPPHAAPAPRAPDPSSSGGPVALPEIRPVPARSSSGTSRATVVSMARPGAELDDSLPSRQRPTVVVGRRQLGVWILVVTMVVVAVLAIVAIVVTAKR